MTTVPTSTSVDYQEESMRSADGTALHLHTWAPADAQPKARVLIVHGYMEHGGRYREFAHALCQRGISASALDLRGHGRSEGRRGFVLSYESYWQDLEAGLAHLAKDRPRFLLGHSNGGLIALDAIGAGRPLTRELTGVVVTNPYLHIAIEVPAWKALAGKVLGKTLPAVAIESGLPSSGLSRDPQVGEAYDRDPLVFSKATAGWFVATELAQQRVQALRSLPLPCLYAYSDRDPVASPAYNRRLAEQLKGDDLTVVLREGGYHEILNETDRKELYEIIGDWILERSR